MGLMSDRRFLVSCLIAGGLLVLPSAASADNKGKGDNKDDARSGQVDRKGDGNSGQGDDLHKKGAPGRDHDEIERKLRELGTRAGDDQKEHGPDDKDHCEKEKGGKPHGEKGEVQAGEKGEKKEFTRPDHSCDKDRCFDRSDRAALEELKRRCAALRDRADVGERDFAELDGCAKRLIASKKVCPDLFGRIRRELAEECKHRRAESDSAKRDDHRKPPPHRCTGEKCGLCGDFRKLLEEVMARLRDDAKGRCRDHAGEGDGCGNCGAIRKDHQEKLARIHEEFRKRCDHDGGTGPGPNIGDPGRGPKGPGPFPPTAAGDPGRGPKGPKGNNGVGNGLDPQPPGNPPVNDGAGRGPGQPGNRGGAPGGGRR